MNKCVWGTNATVTEPLTTESIATMRDVALAKESYAVPLAVVVFLEKRFRPVEQLEEKT